jgi:hypothetical protein
MPVNPPSTPDLEFAFDVGHSSIGWAILKGGKQPADIDILGCGVVTFRADDCLASSRRAYRRQRRHIRSTRQRIERMKRLLVHLKVMTREELDQPGCAWPWLLAARALSGKSGENKDLLLSWAELWDVLRWYAHNRGYDGNKRWSANGEQEEAEDTEKVENARGLLEHFKTSSMAETVCAVLGIDPLGPKRSANTKPADRFKARNAAFPREVVEAEVRRILKFHEGKLPGVDLKLIMALMTDAGAIPAKDLKFPKRYRGGLLFGQLVPRFDNRIISKCPISGEKVPGRNCREFYDFRWGMQLANVRVSADESRELRALSAGERQGVDAKARRLGKLTPKRFMELVRAESKCVRDNLETMLMHPDAEKALLIDPVQVAVKSGFAEMLFEKLPEIMQRKARVRLMRFKTIQLGELLAETKALGGNVDAFESEVDRIVEAANTKLKKSEAALTREIVLAQRMNVRKQDGRAAYSRGLLAQAFKEVMVGKHPKEAEGCLFITDEIRDRELNRPIAEQTNNHLVRHRLLILERLAADLIKEYAGGKASRVAKLTIEVNRDLREMSGMTAKQKAQDMGLRLSNHRSVAEKLAEALKEQDVEITAGLIRKARIADDLGWTCPYTGQKFEPIDLVTRRVDKDHIVPRSMRASDSLDSLVVTFAEVNRMKGQRTAMGFIDEQGGKMVDGMPTLSLRTPALFKEFVNKLEAHRGHDDDKKRKKRRKELLLLADYEEKEFVPRDLTVTSQLVRLGAQALRRQFGPEPVIVSQPGSVTGSVRKAWDVLGCLSAANPEVFEKDGTLKSKTDIRDVTHMHHALDACVLGLSSRLIGSDGRIWELLVKRKWTAEEERQLMALKLFGRDAQKQFRMLDLDSGIKEQIRAKLAERRVVQHIPARMNGMRAEQNIWRVVSVQNGEAELTQAARGVDQKRVRKPATTEKTLKLVGVFPGGKGKLAQVKGALVIADNYGVALDPQPQIIPFHKVPVRLREIKKENGEKAPRVLRNGQLLCVKTGSYQGVWKIFSIKNNSSGIAVDIGRPDIVRLRNKTEGHKINVILATLVKNGLEVISDNLSGISSCLTTSSTSMDRSAR